MRIKKLAIVCTLIGTMLFGASVAVFADISLFAKSEGNQFNALVGTNPEEGLLLSDYDEYWAGVIHDTFYGENLSPYGDLTYVGTMNVWNTTADDVRVMLSYGAGEGQGSSLAYDFEILIIKRTGDTTEEMYQGPLGDLLGQYVGTLEAGGEGQYEMYAGTTRLFSPDETETSIDFNINVIGNPNPGTPM